MNDRYLYRAKRIDNGEWVEGYFVKNKKLRTSLNDVIFTDIDSEIPECFEFYEVDENTICQFTGMKTKSGRKVWENDIIQHQYGKQKAAVRFGTYQSEMDTMATSHCGFYVDWEEKEILRKDLGYWLMMGVETIGNCIDNPELLKEGAE